MVPAALLMAAVVTYMVARRTDRWHYEYSLWFLVLVLPVLWLALTPLGHRLRGRAAGFALLGVIGIAYMGVLQVVDPGTARVDWGRWALRCGALSAAICVLACRPPPRAFLGLLGATAAAALTLGFVVNLDLPWSWWPLGDIPWFGLGNVNYLVNSAGPIILAWALLITVEHLARRPVRWSETLWCLAGLGALAWYAWHFGRRGVTLAAAAVVLWPLWVCWWRAHRRSALAAAMIMTALGGIGAWHLFQIEGITSSGMHRVALYKAMAVLGMEGLPWGWGHYGAMHLYEAQHHLARDYAATTHWAHHAHNVFLDVLIDGGVILLLTVVGQCALCAWHIARITDPTLRLGAGALAIATFIHMGTSVVYGTPVGDAIWHISAAAILICPAVPDRHRFRLPATRWLLWPVALGAVVVGAIPLLRPVTMHRDASIGVRWDTLRQARSPSSIESIYRQLQEHITEHGALVIGEERIPSYTVVEESRKTLGTVSSWPFLNLTAAAQVRNRILALNPNPALKREALRQLADGYVLYLERLPFDEQVLVKLADDLDRSPDLAQVMPKDLVARARYLRGDATMPPPDLRDRPIGVEAHADFFARVRWSIIHERPWQVIAPALRHLVERHGDVPAVGRLAIRAAIHAGLDPHFTWIMDHIPKLERHTHRGEPMIEALQDIGTPTRAAAVFPLIRALYPEFYRRLESKRNPVIAGSSHNKRKAEAMLVWLLVRAHDLAHRPPDTDAAVDDEP